MVGTAGLPHVIIRFFTVPWVRDARISVGWALVFIALLYTTAPAADYWWLGISPEGIGTVGMLLNFAVTLTVSRFTPPPPPEVRALIERVRIPRGAGQAHEISA